MGEVHDHRTYEVMKDFGIELQKIQRIFLEFESMMMSTDHNSLEEAIHRVVTEDEPLQ